MDPKSPRNSKSADQVADDVRALSARVARGEIGTARHGRGVGPMSALCEGLENPRSPVGAPNPNMWPSCHGCLRNCATFSINLAAIFSAGSTTSLAALPMPRSSQSRWVKTNRPSSCFSPCAKWLKLSRSATRKAPVRST